MHRCRRGSGTLACCTAGCTTWAVRGQPAVRHAIRAQRIELGQAELQRVEAEQVGNGNVEVALLPLQNVTTCRGLQPVSQTYNRAFRHEPDCPARLR